MNVEIRKHRAAALLLLITLFCSIPAAAQQMSPQIVDAQTRNAVLEGAIQALKAGYVFPETAQKMEQAIRERITRKEYDALTDAAAFARALTAHLQEVSKDKHLRVIVNDGATRFSVNDPAQQRLLAGKRNFGFERVERLSGNIGYLDLRGFEDASAAGETAAAALTFLANTDALIIDLRNNGGGSPEMVALLSSYFFDKRTHLNDIYERPQNSTREFWTQESVPGKRYGNKPVYLLTSQRTFSAAEEFTYNLKNLKRVTIIGETTGGGAHPVMPRRLGERFIITVPFARAINPITKTNWEGVGVAPDLAVPAAQALKAAHLAALKNVQQHINDPALVAQLQNVIETTRRELDEQTLKIVEGASPAVQSTAPAAAATTAPAKQESAAAETKLPDTPAGRTLGAFLKAFNTGEPATMRKFHREHGGDEENAEKDMGFYQQSGGLRLHSVKRSEPHEIEVLAQTKQDGQWIIFLMGVETQAPHSIASIRVQQTEAPASTAPNNAATPTPANKPDEATALKQLENELKQRAANDSFSGVVLIAKNGQPLFQHVSGLASKEHNTPNRLDTKFNLGSINKFFTAVAINQLLEQGKLALDDTVGKHLPAYPNKQAAEKVTIKHLLNMQSGIGDFFGPKFQATPKTQIRALKDYLPLFAEQPLAFEPGTKRAYSNGGFIVLGLIIEKVTGQSYYDYVRARIFKPAGMLNTDSYEADAHTPNLANGYTRNSEQSGVRVNNSNTRPARGSSAGGGYSTAEDLLKFTLALQNNKLLSPARTKQMLGGGLGIAGGAPGINAVLECDPPSGYTVIVLANYDPPSAEELGRKIRTWLSLE